jgi:hypothetical protein
MKYLAFVLFFGISVLSVNSQTITTTTPARLQVYTMKTDGKQAVMTSEYLSISYDQLKMTGELMLNTLATDDEVLRALLDTAVFDKITFSAVIPEGQFIFQSMVNSRFSVETDIFYGEQQSRLLIDFDVSNRNTSLANTFDISCTGNISLSDNLGITRDVGLSDKISFQFFQNVQTKTY